MNKYILMDNYTIKTCIQGALGAMTFGMYHQFTTNKMMELNNQLIRNDLEKQRAENEKQRIENEKQRIENEKIKATWFW